MAARRRVLRTALLAFAGVYAVSLLVGLAFGRPVGEAATNALPRAAVWAVLAPLMQRGAEQYRGRRATNEDRSCQWRTYDGDAASRWRGGWVHRVPGGVAVVPSLGPTTLRIAAGDVREVTARAWRAGERWSLHRDVRVLEVTYGAGRADLAVLPDDVDTVRGWLGVSPATP